MTKALSTQTTKRDAAFQLLLNANRGSEVITALLEILRKKGSLRSVCKRLNIKSSGYLSDVLNGRRKLSLKYAPGIAREFALEKIEERYLCKLLELERCKNNVKKLLLEKETQALRRMLIVKTIRVNEVTEIVFFALEIFNAIGMFGNRARFAEIASLYPKARSPEIHAALAFLNRYGVVAKNSDEFSLVTEEINFRTPGLELDYAQLMHMAIKESLNGIGKWYQKREKSHFESTVLSIHSKNLPAKLENFRARLQELYSEMEETPADMLIRLNVQCFPIALKE